MSNPEDARTIVRILRAEGGAPGESLHSWRCEYPGFGPCTCLDRVADRILRALSSIQDTR